MYDCAILGGGIAGLSLASFLDRRSIVIEAQDRVGGLSRSYRLNGIDYDIGPHVIFSKNQEVLDLHSTMIETNRIKRSNQIVFKGRYVKYPFENDLSALDPADRDYCLQEFLHNPYERFSGTNMLHFFLGTFGEGITRLYLQPYNEKIWKFDPSCMDTQMVERIPKPPRDDVIASANGTVTEGYQHQLYYHYPAKGGFQTLVDAYKARAEAAGQDVRTSSPVRRLTRLADGWTIETGTAEFQARQLISSIPIHELFKLLTPPAEVAQALQRLLYNSIYIVVIQCRKDKIGDHFALYVPDSDVLFHRVSKLNHLGEGYSLPDGGSTLMAEVTFRPNSYLSTLRECEVIERTIADLEKVGFIDRVDVVDTAIRRERYAYVIYDLDHRRNVDKILAYLEGIGIKSVGRFAEFEYLNTDAVVERTLSLARSLNCAH
ncbi:protoporphyrinogen/coproporphyrinogen oxidase [Methylobacterium oryzihabitans]|uniref:FAD-dependent oxidoreductase n=1 Tax=Methylobacterium oryzihabitans TaxID=2499852 RepID=A0A3S2YR48_9HYPH|nr:FAD-dependent oxidoreductase [Methylobacterium oryzihabitans]RVU17530.1 FAD-dependent oxidoreductase [Methylobacterium oryzihabitans]